MLFIQVFSGHDYIKCYLNIILLVYLVGKIEFVNLHIYSFDNSINLTNNASFLYFVKNEIKSILKFKGLF